MSKKHMKRDYSRWIVALVIGAILLTTYMIGAYGALFDRRSGYLYDPSTDDVFLVDLAPKLSPFMKWQVFNPFFHVKYTEPEGGEYLGKLSEVLKEAGKDQRLLDDDFEAWAEKQQSSFRIGRELEDGTTEIDVWNFEYFTHLHGEPKKIFTESLSRILGNIDGDELSSILVVDAVVAHRTVILEQPENQEPPSLRVIKKGILLKNEAAARLSEAGVQQGF